MTEINVTNFSTTFPASQTDNEEYYGHKVFSDLKYYIEFYDMLSFSIPGTPTPGTGAIINLDALVYSSIQGTLESVQHVLKNGRIGDAYALLRKYYDSAIINIYTNIYMEENRSIESFVVEKITNWFNGKERLPKYRQMSQYIRNSSTLKPVTDLLYQGEGYRDIRNRCNDSMHYNSFDNITINDNQLCWPDRRQCLNIFLEDIKAIFILHMGYIFFLHDQYMASSDYIDALEVGVTPEKDSQYWVASFVQDAFNDIIAKERPEIADLIKQNSCMQLS